MNTKVITPDLHAISCGLGAAVPAGLIMTWVDDAKGRPALRLQPTKLGFDIEDEWLTHHPFSAIRDDSSKYRSVSMIRGA